MKQLSLKEFFEVEHAAGQTQDNKDYMNLHYEHARRIIKDLNPKRVVEIGPGPGALLEYFVRYRTDIFLYGYDINPHSMNYFLSRNPNASSKYFLENIEEMEFGWDDVQGGVIVSTETFEHIPDQILDKVLPKLTKSFEWMWFSSTPMKTNPEQDYKWGHINVKYSFQWVNQMKKHGWEFHSWKDIPTEWSMLFKSNRFQR